MYVVICFQHLLKKLSFKSAVAIFYYVFIQCQANVLQPNLTKIEIHYERITPVFKRNYKKRRGTNNDLGRSREIKADLP